MGMMQQILPPGMQDGEKPETRAEMFRVSGNGQQGFGNGAEENSVDDLFVVESDLSDLFGHSENNMEVFDRQQFRLPAFKPLCPVGVLALRTMAVPAGV